MCVFRFRSACCWLIRLLCRLNKRRILHVLFNARAHDQLLQVKARGYALCYHQ